MLRKMARRFKKYSKSLSGNSLRSSLRVEPLEARTLLSTWTVSDAGPYTANDINTAIADGDNISVTADTTFTINADTDLIGSLTVASGKTLTVNYSGGSKLMFGSSNDQGDATITISGTMTTNNAGGGGGTIEFSPTTTGNTLTVTGAIGTGDTTNTITVSDGSTLQLETAATSFGTITYGDDATINLNAATATIKGVTPETNGDDLTISLAEGANLTVTDAIDLDAGEVLNLQGTIGLTDETLTSVAGIVLDDAAAKVAVSGDTADAFTLSGNVTADADGVILDLDSDLTITGTLAMTAGQGDLTLEAGTSTLNTTIDVNNNTLTVNGTSGTISTVQLDTDNGILNADASVTVTNLNISGTNVELDVASGKTLTVGTSSITAAKTVKLDEAGTVSNLTFDNLNSVLDVNESCKITSLTINDDTDVKVATGKTLQLTDSSTASGKTLTLSEDGTVSRLELDNDSILSVSQSCTISSLVVSAASSPTLTVAAGQTLTLSAVSVESGGDLNLPNAGAGSLAISSALDLAGSLDLTAGLALANNVSLSGDATISTGGFTLTTTVDVNGNTLTLDQAGTISAVQVDVSGGAIDFNNICDITALSITADATINAGGRNLAATAVTVDNAADLTVDEAGGTISSVTLTDGNLNVDDSNTITTLTVSDDSIVDVASGKTLTANTGIAAGKTLTLSGTGTISTVSVDSGEILDINANAVVTTLNLADGAIVDVASGVTWTTAVDPAGDITLRGSGTISSLTMADPTKTVTKDTGSSVTVTTFDPGYTANGQTLSFDGTGTLTIDNAVDFSTVGGQTFQVSAGTVVLDADQTIDHADDRFVVAANAALTFNGSVTVSAAGATVNVSGAVDSTINFAGNNETLTAVADQDFAMLGNVNFTGGTYNMAGAFEFQLGDTLIETGAELEYEISNGTIKFVGGSTVTLQGTAVLDLGSINSAEITVDSVDGATAFTIDRGPSTTTLDLAYTDISNCTYDSNAGVSAYLEDDSLLTNVTFSGSNNTNWTNRAPSASLSTITGIEDAANIITLTSTENAADDDDFTISYKINSLPGNGTLYQYDAVADDNKGTAIAAGDTVSDSSGRVVYVAEQDGFGSAYTSLTYIAFDSQVESSAGTLTISITDVNDPPTFTPFGDVAVAEDSGEYSEAWALNLSAGPGEDGQIVVFLVSVDDSSLFEVAPAITTDGTLVFTPADGVIGSTLVSVTASDSGGTLNGGDNTADSVDFTLVISGSNDAPVLTVPAGLEVEGTTETTVAGISVSDIDAGSSDIKVTLSTQSGSLSFTEFEGSITEVNAALAGLTYTRGISLSDTIRIQVDDQGNTGSGGNQSDIEYIDVTVTNENNNGGGTNTPGDNGYVSGESIADTSNMVYLDIDENSTVQAYLDLDGDGLEIGSDPAVTLTYDEADSLWTADIVDAATDGDNVQYGWQTMYVIVDGAAAEESTVLVPNRVEIDRRNPLVLDRDTEKDIKVSIQNGTGTVILLAEQSQAQELYSIEISGGDRANVRITGGTRDVPVVITGDIDIDGGLKTLNAAYVDFDGDITIDGSCGSIKAADLAALTVTGVSDRLQIKVDDLTDSFIQCDQSEVSLTANSISGSSISAKEVDRITSKGGIELDITASEDVGKITARGSYSGDITALYLDTLKADSAADVNFDISGGIKSISVKNDVSGSIDANSLGKFTAGSLTDADFTFNDINSMTIKSRFEFDFVNSTVTADNIDKLLLRGKEAGTISGSITAEAIGRYQRAFGRDKVTARDEVGQIDSYDGGAFTVNVI